MSQVSRVLLGILVSSNGQSRKRKHKVCRGLRTASQVMSAQAGPERDKAIDSWCASVWSASSDSHQAVTELLQQYGIP